MLALANKAGIGPGPVEDTRRRLVVGGRPPRRARNQPGVLSAGPIRLRRPLTIVRKKRGTRDEKIH